MDNKGRIAATGVGAVIGAPFAYFTTKVFEAWAVLDDLASKSGIFLKKNITPEQAGWTFGLLIYSAFLLLLWWIFWHNKKSHTKSEAVPIPDKSTPPPPAPAIEVIGGNVDIYGNRIRGFDKAITATDVKKGKIFENDVAKDSDDRKE